MKLFLKSAAVLSILSMAATAPVMAQQTAPTAGMTTPMPGMTMPMKPGAVPVEGSMMSAMDKMSKDMAALPMTGDADRDFAGMMIPHHEGAIEMAKYELAHGKDPAMLKLAREVVAAQEREIAGMKAWLTMHPAVK